MTGEAPQPGETPRTESNPWPFADPDASQRPRHPRRRAPQGGAGLDLELDPDLGSGPPPAYEMGVRDVAQEMDPAIKQRAPETEAGPAVEEPLRDPAGQERDHDRADSYRYDPLRPPAALISDPIPDLIVDPIPDPDPAPDSISDPDPDLGAAPEPDVMVLPEPNTRNRPTVSLGPVPEQGRSHPAEPLPRATGDPITDARLARVENSPFWLDEHERPAGLDLPEPPTHTPGARRPTRHTGHRPAPALFALVTLALFAAFFAWVSAEPFWLAVGHGDAGRATTVACTGHGVTQRCTGTFAAADGHFAVGHLTLLGVTADKRAPGAVSDARMVSRDSRQAYLGSTGLLRQLRWILGFLLVLICGYGIASLTGARRFGEPRARRFAVLLSLAGPLALLAGFLVVTY